MEGKSDEGEIKADPPGFRLPGLSSTWKFCWRWRCLGVVFRRRPIPDTVSARQQMATTIRHIRGTMRKRYNRIELAKLRPRARCA